MNPRLNALGVSLSGTHIGVINRLGVDTYVFAFEQSYLENPSRPILSLSFKSRTGGVLEVTKPVRRNAPPFFSNLLPEAHLRTYLAERAGVKSEHEFLLLAALGADLSGAVTIFPMSSDGLTEIKPADLEEKQEKRRHRNVMRFSLAGVQLKFSALLEKSGSLTVPVNGVGGSWIVKLPSTTFPSVPENEFAMLSLARAVGITVPATRLVPVAEIEGLPEEAARLKGRALVVERFDRGPGGRRIHMEDFAQVFGRFPDEKYKGHSYANVAAVLQAEQGREGVDEFVKRIAFSVAIGNADMHLKNWSLVYPDGRNPKLSPAYDFIATFLYIPNGELALSFGGSKDPDRISAAQIRKFADTAGLAVHPLLGIVQETLERTQQAWKTLAEKSVLPSLMRKAVGRRIEKVALAGEVK